MRTWILTGTALAILSTSALARCGDCNGDGNTNILDALRGAQHGASLIVLTGSDFIRCNVNGTRGSAAMGGSVDILDALKTAQFSAGLATVLKCDEPVWPIRCGAVSTDTITTAGLTSPPALGLPGTTHFYSLEGIPSNAISVTLTLIFNAPADYDLLAGGSSTVPGDTNQANYPLQSRFTRPEVITIDAGSTPSVSAIAGSGNPWAIAVYLNSMPGNSYTLSISCVVPIPPSVININLGSSTLQSTTASSSPGPDLLVTGSTHWFVLQAIPPGMQHLDITVTNLSGNHDVYLGAPTTMPADQYTFPRYPTASATAMMVEQISVAAAGLVPYGTGPVVIAVTAVTPGNFTIEVRGYSDITCGALVNHSITAGTSPTRGRLTNAAATRLYKLDGVPLTATEIKIEMMGTTPAGDVDLYVGSNMWGDTVKANYDFLSETVGTSNETVIIDAMSTPDIFTFLGNPIAIAVSAFSAGDVTLNITCMTGGGPPGMSRTVTCGGSYMGMVTSPSGTATPPLLARPGSTDFYCMMVIPVGTAFVTFRVTGAPGNEFMVLVGDPATLCGSTNPIQYVFSTTPQQNPEVEVSVCTNPSIGSYVTIPVAVHWVAGGSGMYTLDVICDPSPIFCAPTVTCSSQTQDVLIAPTGQAPGVAFTRDLDTHFYMLFPVPQGTSTVTINLGSLDPDADYDLFVGGPLTPPCAGSSGAYMYASQQFAPDIDTVVLTGADLTGFGCNPIPIAVYYYADGGAQGGYTLQIDCN